MNLPVAQPGGPGQPPEKNRKKIERKKERRRKEKKEKKKKEKERHKEKVRMGDATCSAKCMF